MSSLRYVIFNQIRFHLEVLYEYFESVVRASFQIVWTFLL